jgi:PAS domain S-box-containing protein
MSVSLWSNWNSIVGLGITKPNAAELALLVVLGASLLALRSFRETYLKLWVAAWFAFVASRLAEHSLAAKLPAPFDLVAVHALFVLAVGLMAGAILLYVRARDLIVPLAVITPILVGFSGARVLLWPDSLPLRVAVEVGYRLVLLTTAIAFVRARRGRWEPSAWLVALCILTLHLSWSPFTDRIPSGLSQATEIGLGISMLLVVFDQSRARTRRLQAMQALTTSIATAQQYGNVVQTAVEQMQEVTSARASWFRLIEGRSLVATHAVGLSSDFLRDSGFAEITEEVSKLWQHADALVTNRETSAPEAVSTLEAEKIGQFVIVPVLGNKSPIGLLMVGSSFSRQWTQEELDFLQACAKQVAVAIENFRLLEQVLRSQRQWMNTFDSIHDIILAHDADFRIIKANQVLLEQISQAPADVLGSTCESVLPHTFGNWTGCPYCAMAGSEEFAEGADTCFGGFSTVSTSSYTEQGSPQKGIIHVVRDITERRSAEEKYRLLFEQVQEGVYVANPAGRLIDCNDAFVKMLGYGKREELQVLNLDTEICVDPRQRETFRREMEAHNFVRNFDVSMRRKDGTLLLAIESSFAKRDSAGNIERYQGFVLDMTEKRRAEEEMRRRNRELNALNAMAVVAAQSFDLDEILNLTLRQVVTLFSAESGSVYLSDSDTPTYRRRAAWGPRGRDQKTQGAEVLFAEGFGDLVMRSRTEVITAEYLPHLPPKVAEFLRADSDRSSSWVLFWGKDSPVGIMGLCSQLGYEYSSNDENLLVAISRQLATTIEKVRLYEETCRAYEDLRKTQEQLLQSEKMSAVGQLIAGVAHELNNPLTAILGYAELLESEGLNSRAQDYVSKLFKQAQRTHRVVQNLLSFARQRKPQREEVDVRKVLDETLALRDYDLKINNIRVDRDVPSEPAMVIADPHQIEQVFLNIINNGVDAILETGRKGKLKIRVYSQNGHVCTQFTDDGAGIKDPKRIFDPFYTTKSVGKGTGLGLSICYGIVKEHGGDVTANNAPEGGAQIEVRLPAVAAALAAESLNASARQHDGALHGRVLLVEEEEAVLEFERDVLAGAGAAVVTARNSEDVKTRLLSEHFDAVIMNGKMPGQWSAKESYTWLKTNCPGMEEHVLFTFSNGVDPGDGRSFLQDNNAPCLVKPFEVGDLIAHARRLLPKAQAASAS